MKKKVATSLDSLLLVLGACALPIGFGVYMWRKNMARIAAVGVEAERLGLSFEPNAAYVFDTRWSLVPPFVDWKGQWFLGALVEAPDISIFEYQHRGGPGSVAVRLTFAARRVALPSFVLRGLPGHSLLPRKRGPVVDPITHLFLSDEARARVDALLPVELPEPLAANYALRADPPSPDLARALVPVIGSEPGWTIYSYGEWVFVGHFGPLEPERLGDQVANYRRVLDGLVAELGATAA